MHLLNVDGANLESISNSWRTSFMKTARVGSDDVFQTLAELMYCFLREILIPDAIPASKRARNKIHLESYRDKLFNAAGSQTL